MELDKVDIGLYVEDDDADVVVTAALEAGWLPRFRRAHGALVEVVFLPSEMAPSPPLSHSSSSSPTPSFPPRPLPVPPELTVAPFLSPEKAAPTLAAHLVRAHPFSDRTLARFGADSSVLLYGWLEPVPAPCLVQYAEVLTDGEGLSAADEATLSQHLLPQHDSADVAAPPPPAAAPAPARPAMSAPTGLARPTAVPPPASIQTTESVASPPVFHVVRGELQFRLHIWSTPHTVRAMERHLTLPATTTAVAASSAPLEADSTKAWDPSVSLRNASTTTDAEAPPPPPQPEELTNRDDTPTVKNALNTVIKLSQLMANHPDAEVNVFTDATRSRDTEYVVIGGT